LVKPESFVAKITGFEIRGFFQYDDAGY